MLENEEGLQTMHTLGRNMTFLMMSIQMGQEKMGLQENQPTIFTSLHHERKTDERGRK